MKVLNEMDSTISTANFLDKDFLSLNDIIQNNYSKRVMKVLRHIKELENLGQLEDYGLAGSEMLGKGCAGGIFPSTEPGMVVKVSMDSNDYDVAQAMAGSGRKHLAKLGSVKKVKGPEDGHSDRDFFFIQMEKLNDFDENEQNFLKSTIEPLMSKINDDNKVLNKKIQKKFSKRLYREIRNFYKNNQHGLSSKEKRLCRNLLRFLRELHQDGYHFGDRQTSQFMKGENGMMKLVDYGSVFKS